jgi:hypothetical protein
VTFAFIKQHRKTWPVAAMCRVLKVSRSGFVAWCKRPRSMRQKRQEELIEKLKAAHRGNRELYGSPRLYRALRIDGQTVCRNTVAKLMRIAGTGPKHGESSFPAPPTARIKSRWRRMCWIATSPPRRRAARG